MFTCSVCFKSFTLSKNLYQHMRNQHKIEPAMPGAKMICPLFCVVKFRTRKELRTHLELFHKIVLVKEELSFPDYEAFEAWKARVESSSGDCYVCRISERVLRKGEAKSHFYCHRSGFFQSESTGQRRARRQGSKKIGSHCPSSMEVSRSVADGKVHVLFWKTHVGHSKDHKKQSLPKVCHPKIADSITCNVHVVLPAAGIGERMGLNIPKQYIELHGKPIICYTADAFLRLPFVKKVIVVAAPNSVDLMVQTLSLCNLKDEKLMITEGCKTRHRSIFSGIKVIENCASPKPDVIIIHDGVRPFISEEIICNVVTEAMKHGAAGIICPLVSTVLSVKENNFLDTCLDRNKYKASEMPQAFRLEVISKAYAQCSEEDFEHGTECLHLVQKYCNINVKLLPGSTNLWKVTHRKDIYAAAACVKENQYVSIITNEALESSLSSALKISLCKKFKYVHITQKLDNKVIDKFENIVKLWNEKSVCDVIDELTNLYSNLQAHSSTAVHILLDSIEQNRDFFLIQNLTRSVATTLRDVQILIYFILPQKEDLSESLDEIAELTTSLLFDSNPNLSGNIFVV